MANTRRKIKVLVDRNELRARGLFAGTIVDAQVSGNRATPFPAGLRTIHLKRGEWTFATAEEVVAQAQSNHKLQPKDDPTVGDGSVSPDGDGLDASTDASSGPVEQSEHLGDGLDASTDASSGPVEPEEPVDPPADDSDDLESPL
jgi:hypothetical protein